jgi:PHD/YefM family antitoxin component YafN of YafNO toxin-antitoxin module
MLTAFKEPGMRQFTTVELLRDLKTVTHAAAREPVAITQHRKARFVLMAIEDFERLRTGNPDPRKAYRVDETPPALATLLAEGLDRIIDGEDGTDGQ